MEKLIKGYDLSTLDINGLTLNMIPNFTSEMEARRKELYDLSTSNPVKFTVDLRVEYATLEFTKTADTIRDRVMADGVVTADEETEVTRALQALARIYKLRAGVDSY